jgi:hypothetical protein
MGPLAQTPAAYRLEGNLPRSLPTGLVKDDSSMRAVCGVMDAPRLANAD